MTQRLWRNIWLTTGPSWPNSWRGCPVLAASGHSRVFFRFAYILLSTFYEDLQVKELGGGCNVRTSFSGKKSASWSTRTIASRRLWEYRIWITFSTGTGTREFTIYSFISELYRTIVMVSAVYLDSFEILQWDCQRIKTRESFNRDLGKRAACYGCRSSDPYLPLTYGGSQNRFGDTTKKLRLSLAQEDLAIPYHKYGRCTFFPFNVFFICGPFREVTDEIGPLDQDLVHVLAW